MDENKNNNENNTPHDESQEHEEIRGINVMNPILGFIVDHWQAILLFLVVSGALGTFYTQKLLIAHYKKAYNDEVVLVEKYKTDNANLAQQIVDQSTKIKQYGEDSAAKDKVINDLQKTVDIKQAAIVDLRKKLNAKPTPQTCDESLNYLDSSVDLIKW